MKKGYHFRQGPCPVCGVPFASNWLIRHLKKEHPVRADEGLPEAISQESLNKFLKSAAVLQIIRCSSNGLHIIFENEAILTIYSTDDGLDIDILGPDVDLEGPSLGDDDNGG